MSTIGIHCYKGTGSDDMGVFQLDPNAKLSAVRNTLTPGFIPVDGSSGAYRFINSQSSDTNYADAVISVGTESLIPLNAVLGGNNQLIVTNTSAKRPDLVGIGTDWLFNRYVGVQVALNESDPDAVTQNNSIKAFAPLMLSNVIPTNPNVPGTWDNVCVCVENSVVQFSVSSWGAAGFQYYIAPDEGEAICDGQLNIVFDGNPNHYGSATLRRYVTNPVTIQIVGTDSQGITGADVLRYQKITVKTRRITSYNRGSQTYSSNAQPPVLVGTAEAEVADAGGGGSNQKAIANGQHVDTVAGDSIKPGTAVEGPASQQTFGSISNIVTDDWTEALGEINIFFFVFKSWEAANAVINGYNAPDPTLWS